VGVGVVAGGGMSAGVGLGAVVATSTGLGVVVGLAVGVGVGLGLGVWLGLGVGLGLALGVGVGLGLGVGVGAAVAGVDRKNRACAVVGTAQQGLQFQLLDLLFQPGQFPADRLQGDTEIVADIRARHGQAQLGGGIAAPGRPGRQAE